VRDTLPRAVPAKVAVAGMTRFSGWTPPALGPEPPSADRPV
jgi:hypothetical protein